ncbi:MAG TPA: STAS domain-containing protein [Kofleriaceae bacterium]|nr:STAS domain-containing protein [Kofleriaceae bacterium]
MDETLVRERIADILMVLSSIGSGAVSERLRSDLDDDDPFTILYEGINEVVENLVSGQERLESYQRELEHRLRTIEQQRSAIRELSTPVLEVWDRVLCLPVVGVVDTARSAEMTEALLRAVTEKKTRCAIVDVTGIEVMDSSTTDHFLRMARAVRLLGAECVLAGINPTIAQTIVHMGVDLTGVVTFRSLREALQHHVVTGVAGKMGVVAEKQAPAHAPGGRNGGNGLSAQRNGE